MLDKARRPGSPQPEPGPAASRRGPGTLSRSWSRAVRPVAGAVRRRRKKPADPSAPCEELLSRSPARETEKALEPVAAGEPGPPLDYGTPGHENDPYRSPGADSELPEPTADDELAEPATVSEVADPAVVGEPPRPTTDSEVEDPLEDSDGYPVSPLQRAAAAGGGLVLAPGWRERGLPEGHRPVGAQLRTAYRWSEQQLAELWRHRPTPAEIRARPPSRRRIADTMRRQRFLLGGLAFTLLLAGGDSATEILVTEQAPAPGFAHRVAVAYPLRLSTPVPSVRRYLDAIDHGERLREQAVVAAAARTTLDRARREAAAAAAGQEQPWINSRPAPEAGTIPPGMIPPSAGGFVLPAPGTFTSGFGSRWGTFHRGIDIAAPIGTPIYAVADGTVVDAGPAQGFGLWVRIRHDDGTVSVYGHMYDFFVSVGERVPAGMQIARMGNRGDSSGPHLHFEIIMDGQHVDPQRWLALHGLSYS